MSNRATPMYSDKTRGGKFPQMVEHKKKVSDQAGACMRTKGKQKNGGIRRRARLADWFVNVKFSEEAWSGQAEATQDLNTKRFKRTLIYFNTDTQYANFRGNPLYQATKRHLSRGSSKKRSVCTVFVNQWTADAEKQDDEIRAWSVLGTPMIRRAALF